MVDDCVAIVAAAHVRIAVVIVAAAIVAFVVVIILTVLVGKSCLYW